MGDVLIFIFVLLFVLGWRKGGEYLDRVHTGQEPGMPSDEGFFYFLFREPKDP